MGQIVRSTPQGISRATRRYKAKRQHEAVRQTGRSRSLQSRWTGPIVIYVADGGDSWSAYLRVMTSRPDWSVARLSRESGIAKSSIFRWMAEGAKSITIDSVYRIADALGDDRANALKAAGNIRLERDSEVDLILNSDRPEREKAAMIDRLMQRREEERQRRVDDLKWMLGESQAG